MKHIITALAVGFCGFVHAQNKLSGTVADENNNPLAGVSVYAPDISRGTTTGADGKYTFNNLPGTNVKLIFSFLGYTASEQIVALGTETTHDVVLEQTTHQMDQVIVSTAFKKLQSQNAMKVEHAEIKALRQQGVATLAEGLATIPGVAQVSTGTSIGKPVIRGLTGNRVLVFSQGVRLENQQFGDEHGLGLNDSGIESVEVIKGPASLLYGSDALGGVLYLNPEKFAAAKTTKADFGQKLFSNTLGSSTNFGIKHSTDSWKFSLRGNYATHSDYQIPDGSRITNTRFNETDVKAGLGFNGSGFSSVLRYNLNKITLGIPENGIAEQTQSKSPDYPLQQVLNQIFSAHNIIFIDRAKLEVDLGYIANDRSEFEESSAAKLHMKLNTFSYDLKFHFAKWGKFETVAGVQGMLQTNENSGEEQLIPDAHTDDFGIFATTNFSWKTNVLQTGLRFDNRTISTSAFGTEGQPGSFPATARSFGSFNASVGYKTDLAENLNLRINVASGFRAPNLAELTSNGVHEGTNRYEIGNANLGTEQNLQADANVELKNSHFEFFANAFYNAVRDYIYPAPSGEQIDGNAVYRYVQGDAVLFGGEAGIHFHPHPLDWLHFETTFETVTGKKANGDYLPMIPANSWNNAIKVEFKVKDWLSDGYAKLNVSTTFRQGKVGRLETPSSDYTLINLGLGGTVKVGSARFEATLNGNNLFNKTYIAHLSRLKSDGIPNIGRNFIIGIDFIL